MSFKRSRNQLVDTLSKLNATVARFCAGEIDFAKFLEEYGYPMGEYALDGHESETAEVQILDSLSHEISLHRRIADLVLHNLCSEQNAAKDEFVRAGRIGPDKAGEMVLDVYQAWKTGTSGDA